AAPAAAADLKIHIQSNPPGALVFFTDRAGIEHSSGLAPAEVRYILVSEDHGCRDTNPIRVRWVSGAEASIPSLHLCRKDLTKAPYVFVRPANATNLEADMQFAVE